MDGGAVETVPQLGVLDKKARKLYDKWASKAASNESKGDEPLTSNSVEPVNAPPSKAGQKKNTSDNKQVSEAVSETEVTDQKEAVDKADVEQEKKGDILVKEPPETQNAENTSKKTLKSRAKLKKTNNKVFTDEADNKAEEEARFSRSPQKSVEANIRRGKDALAKAVTNKTSVHRAMFRNGLGWVDFVWGDEGRSPTSSGKRKGAKGLAHILEARMRKDGYSEQEAIRFLGDMVEAIARGKEISRKEVDKSVRVGIENDGVLVWMVKRPGANSWVVTSYEIKPDARSGGRAPTAPTHTAPSLTRNSMGAGNQSVGQRNKSVNSPPLDKVELDAVIERVAPVLKHADRVVVVERFTNLPAAVQQQARQQGSDGSDIQGVFHNGKIYLVRDKIKSAEQAERILFHEATHKGMGALFGDAKVKQALNNLFYAIGGVRGFNKLADKFKIDLKPYRQGVVGKQKNGALRFDEETRNAILVDELLAHIAETGKQRVMVRVRELVGAIRNWLRRHGFVNLAKYNASDIAYLAKSAREYGLENKSNGDGTRFMVVWHGSPYKFDEFSLDEIGSGEGAQAYGWGLYFASDKDVAQWYKDRLSEPKEYVKFEGNDVEYENTNNGWVDDDGYALEGEDLVAAEALANQVDLDELIKESEEYELDAIVIGNNEYPIEDAIKAKQLIDDGEIEYRIRHGRLYKVDLAPKEDEYLLWDKPISEQSDVVKDAVSAAANDLSRKAPSFSVEKQPSANGYYQVVDDKGNVVSRYHSTQDKAQRDIDFRMSTARIGAPRFTEDMSGKALYREIEDQFDSAEEASKYLHSKGVRGIKYLDGSSRSKGEGRYNYVVFDDNDIEVLARFSRSNPADKKAGVSFDTTTDRTVFARFSSLGNERASVEQIVADAEAILGFSIPFDIRMNDGLSAATPMRFNLSEAVIEINSDFQFRRSEAAQYLTEEVLHGFDSVSENSTISASSRLFDMNGGTVAKEAVEQYMNNGPLAAFLSYPLGPKYANMSNEQKQAELFARLAVVYLGNPQLLKEVMPNAHAVYDKLFQLNIDPVSGDAASSPFFRGDASASAYRKVRGQHEPEQRTGSTDTALQRARQARRLAESRARIARAIQGRPSGAEVTFSNLNTTQPAKIEQRIETWKDDIETAKVQIDKADAVVGVPFDREQEFQEKVAQLDALEKEIMADAQAEAVEQFEGGARFSRKPLSGLRGKIAKYARAVLSQGGHNANPLVIGVISKQEANDIKEATGVDVTGYIREWDAYGVRHAFNRHSDRSGRLKDNEIPLTPESFAYAVDAIKSPDSIRLLPGRNKQSNEVIERKKTLDDGTVIYLEEIRTGRKKLVISSLRMEKPGTTPAYARKSYARSDTGSKINVASADKRVNSPPLDKVELDAVIERVAPVLKHADRVVVVERFTNLPAAVQQQARQQGSDGSDIQGVFHNGKIYLVRDKIKSAEQAERLLFHEATHKGMGALFGDAKVKQALNNLFYAIGGVRGFNKLADQFGIDLKPYRQGVVGKQKNGALRFDEETRNAILVDELLAHIAETGKQRVMVRVRELVGAIRNWLRRHGFVNLAKYNASDIAYLAKSAREYGLENKSNGDGTRFMVVWHGSPYKFDEFSLDAIGSGEGAQAYGWGLYFASKRKVAEWYKNKLSLSKFDEQKIFVDLSNFNEILEDLIAEEKYNRADDVDYWYELLVEARDKAIDEAKTDDEAYDIEDRDLSEFFDEIEAPYNNISERIAEMESNRFFDEIEYELYDEALDQAVAEINGITYDFDGFQYALMEEDDNLSEIIDKYSGAIYKVDIAPEEHEYLLWDEPFSKQPKNIQDAVRKSLAEVGLENDKIDSLIYNDVFAKDIYNKLASLLSPKEASELLLSNGIRGNKYLDGSSRRKGKGSYNYVIFDDNDVEVIARFKRDNPANKAGFSLPEKPDTTFIENVVSTIKEQRWGLLTLSQITEVLSKQVPKLAARYYRLFKSFEARQNELKERAGKIAQERKKLKRVVNMQLSKLQHEATVAGVDPSRPFQPLVEDVKAAKDRIRVLRRVVLDSPGSRNDKWIKEVKDIQMDIAADKRRRKEYDALRARWDRLPQKARAIYLKERDHHEMISHAMREALLKRIADMDAPDGFKKAMMEKLRLEFEKNSRMAPYFPLARFGRYWVSSVDENGEKYFDMFESETAQQRFIKEHGNTLEITGYGKQLKNLDQVDGVNPKFVTEVDGLIKGLGDSPEVTQLRDDVFQLYLESLPELSARKHYIHRKKTKGYYKDQARAFADKAMHDANHVARLEYLHLMQQELDDAEYALEVASSKALRKSLERQNHALQALLDSDDMQPHELNEVLAELNKENPKRKLPTKLNSVDEILRVVEDQLLRNEKALSDAAHIENRTFVSDGLSELKKSHEALANPNTHPIAQALNALGFAWYLGATPAAALVNLAQTPTVAYPLIGAKFGMANAAKHFSSATKDFIAGGASLAKRLSGDEREAFKEWRRSGLLEETMAHDLAGVADAGINTGNFRARMGIALSFMFHHAERMNREITALAAYRAARAKGMSHEQAVQQASDLTYKAHFDYGAGNRARFMRGNVARVVTQFKQYSQNITYLYGRILHEVFKGASAQDRAEARKALFGMLLGQAFVAGSLGMPLASILMGIAQGLQDAFGDEDDPEDVKAAYRQWLADTFGKTGGQLAAKGFFDTFTPFSVSGRLSLSDLWIRTSDRDLEGRAEAQEYMNALAGPMASIVMNLFVAKDLLADGQGLRAMEYAVPKNVKDLLRGLRFANEDALTMSGYKLKEMGMDEVIGQILGFSPSELSELYEVNTSINNVTKRRSKRRAKLIDAMVKARLERDSDARRQAWAAIRKWNQVHPRDRITMKTISQSIRSRKRYSESLDHGVRRTRRNADLLDRYDYARMG